MKRLLTISLTMILAVGLTACMGAKNIDLGVKDVDFNDLSTREKAAWAMKLYTDAVKDYEQDINRPNLSDDAMNYLRKKYEVLVRAWPIINVYKKYADTGVAPTYEISHEMIGIIDELLLYPALGITD